MVSVKEGFKEGFKIATADFCFHERKRVPSDVELERLAQDAWESSVSKGEMDEVGE